MGHKKDYWEKIRRWLIPKLGQVTLAIEEATGEYYYVTSETHANQFVGRVPMAEETFEKVLDDLGFERNQLASLKTLESGEVEEGSWRKVGFDDHPNMQIHAVLYDGETLPDAGDSGYTYVYAHWEMRWDTHPWKHYRGHNYNPDIGVKRVKKMLNEYGVNCEPIRP